MLHFPPDQAKLEEICETIEAGFGLHILAAKPIDRGWLNLKWRLDTDQGILFVKQFHPKRYQLDHPENLRAALVVQNKLYAAGIPCPKVFELNSEPILTTPSSARFILTEYCQGEVIEPGNANEQQMAHLGEVTGRMHAILNERYEKKESLHWTPATPGEMIKAWQKNWNEAQKKPCPEGLVDSMQLQREIIEQTDPTVFASCEQGWTHWDLWADNLLFHPTQLSAILDFDRMRPLYPEMDIAKAMLSCSLDVEAGIMHLKPAKAFLKGYRMANLFPDGALVRAIRLLWWSEALSWMVHDMDAYSAPPARFAKENIWITQHWHTLDDLFGGM